MQQFPVCPTCGSGDSRISAEDSAEVRRRFLDFSDRKYSGVMDGWLDAIELRIRQCRACGHFWYEQQPESEQLAEMYAAAQRLHPERGFHTNPTPAMLAEMRRLYRLAPVGSEGGKPRLLDFGSGHGRWARAAVEAGFQVVAYEPSAVRSQDGQAETDAFRLVHALQELEGQIFEAVNLEQVLEHIPDPGATLAELRQYCHAGTVLRITVPNIERSYEGTALWDAWPWDGQRPHTMAPFEHLHGFTPRSLSALVERCGFKELSFPTLLRCDRQLLARQQLRRIWKRLGTTRRLLTPA